LATYPLSLHDALPISILPYCYILFLGTGVLVASLVAGGLVALGQDRIDFLGHSWSLGLFSAAGLYLLGVAGEILIISSVYLVMRSEEHTSELQSLAYL